jgi:Putative MetA-pathway of phenol degradation
MASPGEALSAVPSASRHLRWDAESFRTAIARLLRAKTCLALHLRTISPWQVRWQDTLPDRPGSDGETIRCGACPGTAAPAIPRPRLANLGLGHNAIDAGGGYTYFDTKTGIEFSAVLGFTYNFENPHTHYQNGVNMHLDIGTSRFVTKQLQLGLVGYAYKQISCDSGAGNRLGCFEVQVFGVGPQIGYVIPMGHLQASWRCHR